MWDNRMNRKEICNRQPRRHQDLSLSRISKMCHSWPREVEQRGLPPKGWTTNKMEQSNPLNQSCSALNTRISTRRFFAWFSGSLGSAGRSQPIPTALN